MIERIVMHAKSRHDTNEHPMSEPQSATKSLAASVLASGARIRRDPHTARRTNRSPTKVPPVTSQCPTPVRVVDDPAFLILVVPDLPDGKLTPSDCDLIGAARIVADKHNGAIVALASAPLLRDDLGEVGVDRLLQVNDVRFSEYSPEFRAAAVLAATKALRPLHILFSETPAEGGDLGRRVAAALGEIPATFVQRFDGEAAVSRGNGGASDFVRSMPTVVLLAAEAFLPYRGIRREARVLPPLDVSVAVRLIDRGRVSVEANAVPLAEADLIISAGNGVSDWPAFHALAEALCASEAGTRVVVDAGHLPRDRQVGASGTQVEPRCYIAFGISGAPQHLQGIIRCERVVAINTDVHADILKRADLAIIADAQAVMPALTSLVLDKRRHDL